MIQDFFVLSVNSMKKRKLRSWLTLLGIFIGIAAVVSLISLGDGLRTAITGQFSSLSADTLVLQNAGTGFGPPGSTVVKKLNDHDIKLAESNSDVKIVIGRLIRVAKVEYNKVLSFHYLGSMPKDKTQLDFVVENGKLATESGRLLKPGERGKIVVGNDFSTTDEFGKKIKVGSKLNVQGKDFEVVGILKKASTFTINSVILMSEDDMKEILNLGNEYDIVVIRVNNKDLTAKVATALEDKFRRDRKEKKGEEDFSIQTPVESLAAINTILNIVNVIVIGIATVSLLIGGIGIANTMYTSVLERTKEIGTMKAIGAKNSDILTLFVIESGLFGLIGGVSGSLVGALLAYSVSSAANGAFNQNILSFNLSWPLIFSAVAFSFFIGIVAGLVPSYQASRLKPVDALRG